MLLTSYRVLDLTGPLAYLTGKMLADLGADVVKLEPPGGDPARRWPPSVDGPDGEPQGLYWIASNAGKRGVTLDLESPKGREDFGRLASQADFVLESFAPGTLETLGLGYEQLCRDNPGLIFVSITPFGQTGPYRDFLGSDLEIMALGGAMSLAGEAGGEPTRLSCPQAPMWVGAEAAMGALTALAHRTLTGAGQRVDVSAQDAVISALAHAPAFWDLNQVNPERAGVFITGRSVHGAKMRAFWRCRDGWINFVIYGGEAGRHTNRQLVAWMDEEGVAPDWIKQIDWSHFEVSKLTQEEVDRMEVPIGEFLLTLTRQGFLEEAVQRGMLGYPVFSVTDIADDRQLEARGFWQALLDPNTGRTLRFPGGFAVVDGQRLAIPFSAPRPGEHNGELLP